MEKNHDSFLKAFDLPGVFEKPFLREHVLSLRAYPYKREENQLYQI
jgi:hypothetical protein